MDSVFRLPETDLVSVGILTMLGIALTLPFATIVLANRKPKERPVTLEEQYPDEHLGI
jgi:hypothetical protein